MTINSWTGKEKELLIAKLFFNFAILIFHYPFRETLWQKHEGSRVSIHTLAIDRVSHEWIMTPVSFTKQPHFRRLLTNTRAKDEWQAANFSLQYCPWIKHWGHENKTNEQQSKNLLIVTQILFVGTLEMCRQLYGEYAYWYWGVERWKRH